MLKGLLVFFTPLQVAFSFHSLPSLFTLAFLILLTISVFGLMLAKRSPLLLLFSDSLILVSFILLLLFFALLFTTSLIVLIQELPTSTYLSKLQ
jgi:hypothetical protein